MHLSPYIPEIALDMVWDLIIIMRLNPSGNPHLNSESKTIALQVLQASIPSLFIPVKKYWQKETPFFRIKPISKKKL